MRISNISDILKGPFYFFQAPFARGAPSGVVRVPSPIGASMCRGVGLQTGLWCMTVKGARPLKIPAPWVLWRLMYCDEIETNIINGRIKRGLEPLGQWLTACRWPEERNGIIWTKIIHDWLFTKES